MINRWYANDIIKLWTLDKKASDEKSIKKLKAAADGRINIFGENII